MNDIDIDTTGEMKIVSNHVGPNGESVDRIYGTEKTRRLVQADYTTYKGNIKQKTILVERPDGSRFRSHVFVTDDDRWFDRGGMPIKKSSVKIDKESDDVSQD